MQFVYALTFVAAICYVYGEQCTTVSTCTGTTCSTTAAHVHLECQEKHCTCVMEKLPCLTITDCNSTARCIDSHGHSAILHCLDGKCNCVDV